MEQNMKIGVAVVVIAIIVGSVGLAIYFQPTAEAAPIKIGLLIPLSEPGGYERGLQVEEMITQFVLPEINAAGGVLGRQIEVIIGDTSGTVEGGVSAARKLITDDGVVALFGHIHSSVADAVTSIAHDYGIAHLVCYASSDSVTEHRYDETFRYVPCASARVGEYMNWIDSMGWDNIAIIVEDTGFGLDYGWKIANESDSRGFTTNMIVFDHTITDQTPFWTLAATYDPDIIVEVFYSAGGHMVQANESGAWPAIPILDIGGLPANPVWWENSDDDGNYIFYSSIFSPAQELTTIGQTFYDDHLEALDRPADFGTFAFYDSFRVVLDSIERSGVAWLDLGLDAQRTMIVENMEETSLMGSFRLITFPSSGPEAEGALWHNFISPVSIVQVQVMGSSSIEHPIVYPADVATADPIEPPGYDWNFP
jgi:ABC-type branched-subunit amino acid transport system substrate-binding protein